MSLNKSKLLFASQAKLFSFLYNVRTTFSAFSVRFKCLIDQGFSQFFKVDGSKTNSSSKKNWWSPRVKLFIEDFKKNLFATLTRSYQETESLSNFFYEMCPHGIMVVVIISLNWIFLLMNTTTEIPANPWMRVSWREFPSELGSLWRYNLK